MCAMMTIVNMKSDYIKNADEIYFQLRSYETKFEMQAKIINEVKCLLASRKNIDDFTIDGVNVLVYKKADNYVLYYLNYEMVLYVYDNQIIDYSISQI